MDIIEKGKKLAQEGNYEEALDTLVSALKNEKNNPDLHFYLGLCYSSLEEFAYAKYHYEVVLTLQPDHGKTNLVIGSLSDVDAVKPPERRVNAQPDEHINAPEKKDPIREIIEKEQPQKEQKPKLNLTDKKWEDAFPDDVIRQEEKSNFIWKILFMIIGIAIVAGLVYYGLSYFE